MRMGTVSWMIVCVKCLDLATGACIARLSDKTRSSWGRRKPFLLVFWPLAMVVWVCMPLAGLIFREKQDPLPCSDLVDSDGRGDASSPAECPVLKTCIEEAISKGTLLAYDSPTADLGLDPDTTSISVWFFFVNAFYFLTFISGSVLVYDALGQELTDDYNERGKLFAVKLGFGMLGAIFGSAVQLRPLRFACCTSYARPHEH